MYSGCTGPILKLQDSELAAWLQKLLDSLQASEWQALWALMRHRLGRESCSWRVRPRVLTSSDACLTGVAGVCHIRRL